MSNSVIKADNIIKKYGRNYALVGVSVEIEKGRIYGLLGRNGAGKSTIIRHLTGVWQDDHLLLQALLFYILSKHFDYGQ